MTEMVARLKDKMRKEIRYARGMQTMHRERYLEYLHDMRVARMHGNAQRTREIASDLCPFTYEMWHLMVGERSAYERLYSMIARQQRRNRIEPDTPTAEDDTPTNGMRLVEREQRRYRLLDTSSSFWQGAFLCPWLA